jgi:hypothetical protein
MKETGLEPLHTEIENLTAAVALTCFANDFIRRGKHACSG